MGVEEVVVVGLICVVLYVGALGGAFCIGKAYNDPLIDSQAAKIWGLEDALKKERSETSARAKGGRGAYARAVDRALATDADGVLDAHFGPPADPATSEHGGEDPKV